MTTPSATAPAGQVHTATPWRIDSRSSTAIAGRNYIVASCGGHSDNRRDAEELWQEMRANAAHIVHCVNTHSQLLAQNAALVEALRTANVDLCALLPREAFEGVEHIKLHDVPRELNEVDRACVAAALTAIRVALGVSP